MGSEMCIRDSSMPALWLKDKDQYAEARDLLDAYQDDRRQRMQSEYQASKQHGEAKTTWRAFKESPIRFISYFTLIAIVLYLSLRFFLSFSVSAQVIGSEFSYSMPGCGDRALVYVQARILQVRTSIRCFTSR